MPKWRGSSLCWSSSRVAGSLGKRLTDGYKEVSRLNTPIIHVIGRRLTPELATIARELRDVAIVYQFASTRELAAAWLLARRNDATECMAPAAVVWLQTRPGEFRQREIDVVAELDPLARPIVVAGCWSEGEPRSGKPLQGVTRVYWHQGIGGIMSIVMRQTRPRPLEPLWVAIHARQVVDYQGLSGVCESLGLRTIWQNDRWPVISSQPDLRLFVEWEAWQAWRERQAERQTKGPEILALSFPRPADFERARAGGIRGVVALPLRTSDLRQAILGAKTERIRATIPFVQPTAAASYTPTIRHLQSA